MKHETYLEKQKDPSVKVRVSKSSKGKIEFEVYGKVHIQKRIKANSEKEAKQIVQERIYKKLNPEIWTQSFKLKASKIINL